MKEIGGFFELENTCPHSEEYHKSGIHLNLGRNALVYLVKAKKIRKIYLPFYLCDSVENAIKNLGVIIEKYHVNSSFQPIFEKELQKDEYLYIVNYFGFFSNDEILTLKNKYSNIIIDNTHAYFQKPNKNTDTLYTCRKFFGVPDGAYLYTSSTSKLKLEDDCSSDRFVHLLGRKNETASKYYSEYVKAEGKLNSLKLKSMSKETKTLLSSIDYDSIISKRNINFDFLDKNLKELNLLKVKKINGAFCYPLLIKHGYILRKKLQEKAIYIPTLWPNLNNLNEFEEICVKNLLPLPCDQRYSISDMEIIIKELKKSLI